jgi:IS5 family transposase
LLTDIIVKGGREVKFGHKVSFTTGRSNLILGCEVLKGNQTDSTLYQVMTDKVIETYRRIPRDIATDGGYASLAKLKYSEEKGIKNIVFNKVVGSLHSIASSLNMETRLKKWRSAIEAIISNVKRGFGLSRCEWKGEEHFRQKVMWSVIAYNIRVMSAFLKKAA